METNERTGNDHHNDQPISKTELLWVAYNLGKKGLIFPGKIKRGDMAFFLHCDFESIQKAKDEIKSRKANQEEIDDESVYTFIHLQSFQRIFEFSNGKYYNVLKNELKKYYSESADESIKMQQILQAFEDGLYYPCACALAAMIEGTLGRAAQSADTRLYELIKNVSPEREHPEKDLILENLKGFISELAKSSRFVTEQEPTFLNRHWLLHGRSEKEIKKIDCLILLNALREILELIHGPSSEELNQDEKEEES